MRLAWLIMCLYPTAPTLFCRYPKICVLLLEHRIQLPTSATATSRRCHFHVDMHNETRYTLPDASVSFTLQRCYLSRPRSLDELSDSSSCHLTVLPFLFRAGSYVTSTMVLTGFFLGALQYNACS